MPRKKLAMAITPPTSTDWAKNHDIISHDPPVNTSRNPKLKICTCFKEISSTVSTFRILIIWLGRLSPKDVKQTLKAGSYAKSQTDKRKPG